MTPGDLVRFYEAWPNVCRLHRDCGGVAGVGEEGEGRMKDLPLV
jgi:hypothetical protein